MLDADKLKHNKNTGRNFIGIELDENYFNIAQKRINQAIQDKGGE